MNIAELAALSADHEDYTKPSEGAVFERELPVAGVCLLRFREYIELGVQKTASAMYPKKKPAMKARFIFELVTPKHVVEVESAEGVKTRFGHVVAVTCVISKDAKATYMKIFKQLNWAGKAKVPAQLLGQPYKAKIFHNYDEKDMKDGKPVDGAKPKWANLNSDGVFSFEAPRNIDPLSETITEIPVPEMLGAVRLFLWDIPMKKCWDSLFVDGTFTKTIDGKEVEVSKNWLQNIILESQSYEGSKLQLMLQGADELEDLPTEDASLPDKPDATELDALMGG